MKRYMLSAMSVWLLITVFVGVLAVVKLTSIRTGPSAHDAMVAIRVAQRDLFEAKKVYRQSAPSALKNAETTLSLASRALQEKRYEEAILAAREASHLVRKLGG